MFLNAGNVYVCAFNFLQMAYTNFILLYMTNNIAALELN